MTKNLLEEAYSSYKPELHAILDYAKACGLEGEEHTVLAGSIAFHGADLCVLVGGASQAGKSHLSEIVMSEVVPRLDPPKVIVNNRDLLFKEGGILAMEFGSKTAIAYTEEKLNSPLMRGLYIPEYQKIVESAEASKLALEALKSFGEGRDVYRDVTDVKKGGVNEQHLKRSNFWANIATENPLKLDVETQNRVLPLFVDVSMEQTRRIMHAKAAKEFIAGRQVKMIPDEMLSFKQFMISYREQKELEFENPFAAYIADNYLPAKYIKSRRAIDFYLAFNRAIAKWHFINGHRVSTREGRILVNIEDIYQTEEIYGARCRFDMLQLDPNSMEIFKIFERYQRGEGDVKKIVMSDDKRVQLDISTIHKELTANGINLKINVVEQMLDELQECGYLEYATGLKQRGTRYMVVDVDKPVHSAIDYPLVFHHGAVLVREYLPDVVDAWEASQKTNGELTATHPFTGARVNLSNIGKTEAQAQAEVLLGGRGVEVEPLLEKVPKQAKIKWSQ